MNPFRCFVCRDIGPTAPRASARPAATVPPPLTAWRLAATVLLLACPFPSAAADETSTAPPPTPDTRINNWLVKMPKGWARAEKGTKAIAPPSPPSNASARGRERRSERGRYRIGNYTLELTYDDGTREYFTFFQYPLEEEQVVSIDGLNYLLRK